MVADGTRPQDTDELTPLVRAPDREGDIVKSRTKYLPLSLAEALPDPVRDSKDLAHGDVHKPKGKRHSLFYFAPGDTWLVQGDNNSIPSGRFYSDRAQWHMPENPYSDQVELISRAGGRPETWKYLDETSAWHLSDEMTTRSRTQEQEVIETVDDNVQSILAETVAERHDDDDIWDDAVEAEDDYSADDDPEYDIEDAGYELSDAEMRHDDDY